MRKKIALITGITGQDGSYMSDLLLEKDYKVVGIIRRNATRDLGNAKHLEDRMIIEEGDITDAHSMWRLIQKYCPDEIYNFAAMSHVHTSFDQPSATFDVNTKGVVNILEAVFRIDPDIRIYHASTSELWGSSPPPQNEETIMRPRSPYAIAKLASHWMCNLYRESYKMFVTCGITHNHESVRRGPLFVTRKISLGVARCLMDPNFKLRLGNLDAKRDWGWAPDYCEGFYLAMQQNVPEDFVFATGEMHSVRELAEEAFNVVGLNWKDHVIVDKMMKRPSEVDELCGDYTKAKEVLGWEPKVKFKEMIKKMITHDTEKVIRYLAKSR